jgi:hypothetical protein
MLPLAAAHAAGLATNLTADLTADGIYRETLQSRLLISGTPLRARRHSRRPHGPRRVSGFAKASVALAEGVRLEARASGFSCGAITIWSQ